MRSAVRSSPRALLINGTVGAGKTVVAEALGDLLADADVTHAVIDLDWLRRAWPPPPGDHFNGAVTRRNLRDVARNFLDAGDEPEALAWHLERAGELDRILDEAGVEDFAVDATHLRRSRGRGRCETRGGLGLGRRHVTTRWCRDTEPDERPT